MISFKIWLENLNKMMVDNTEILVFQYSPEIQIQSGLSDIDKEYFTSIFGKGKPSESEFKEFIHSYIRNDPSGQMLGSRILIYDNGKIVIGKANSHAFLNYYPSTSGSNVEGYYDFDKKKLTISHSYSENFNKISIWKKALINLKNVSLIDDDWTIFGCPPSCEKNLTVKEIMSKKDDVSGEWGASRKEKESENLVQQFMTQRAIQGRRENPMGFIYRYGENNIKYRILR